MYNKTQFGTSHRYLLLILHYGSPLPSDEDHVAPDSWNQCPQMSSPGPQDRHPGRTTRKDDWEKQKRLVQLRTEALTYWSSRRFEAKKGMESDVTLQKPSLQLKTCSIDFVIANSYQGATVWYLLEERNICKNINQLLSLTWSSVKTQLWLFIRFISMLMNFLFWLQGYYRFWSML